MLATLINIVLVLIGGTAGLIFKNKINENFSKAIVTALALCVLVIGIQSAVATSNMILVIISMVIGTAIGEALKIEDRIYGVGERLKKKFSKSDANTFADGFLSASLLFCVGSMAVMGSMEAGINGDYSIIISKSIIDGVTAISLAATLGVGVLFSSLFVLVYQGGITLIAMYAGEFMTPVMINEMSAVGGLLIIALAINMMGIKKIRAGNMLPAIFIPLVYYPLYDWIITLL
jgi:uncharacterized membrane protein YqgA involved in biofilm formation